MADNDNDTVPAEVEAESSNHTESEYKQVVKMILERESNNFNYPGLISGYFYLLVFLCIGVPIWWRTTTPERWPMPDVASLMVRSQTLAHYYRISVVVLKPDELHSTVISDTLRLKQLLHTQYTRRQSFDGSLCFVNDWSIRSAFEWEQKALESINLRSMDVLALLDEKFGSSELQSINSIVFYVLPRDVNTKSLFNWGNHRAIFVDINHLPKTNEDDEDIYRILASQINQQAEQVQQLAERFYSYQLGDNEQNIMLLLARNFDFLFDIIYEDENSAFTSPTEEEASTNNTFHDYLQTRHQSMVQAIDQLIGTFYTSRLNFSKYFRIEFLSQVLHYVLPTDFIASKLLPDTNNSERLLAISEVHSVLNRIESRRVGHDNEKSYHLCLYVTSNGKKPLKFYDPVSKHRSNLITTPFRGSLLIVNDKEDLFEGFHQLMRAFFRMDHNLISHIKPTSTGLFTQYEIEAVVHALVQKHILKTLASLESTEKLILKVSNMVIGRDIAERMGQAITHLMQSAQLLENGDVAAAYEHSATAYQLSEKAFFDPSLLSLLYFPDDQKYAIYLPLFMPICLPILHNLRIILRHIFHLSGLSKVKQD